MQTLKGILTKIKFHQANSAIVEIEGVAGRTTVKGPLIAPQLGLEYEFNGDWQRDPKWGRQFVADTYQVNLPTSDAGVRRYLAENCPGIGPATARKLLDAYGADALALCKADPARVAREISGLTQERAEEIAAVLRDNEHTEQLMLNLHDLLGGTKVSRSAVTRIIKTWGNSAAAYIKANPYALTQIDGIGFLTADDVARRTGVAMTAPARIQAGLIHALHEQAFGDGHVYVPEQVLLILCAKLLQIEKTLVRAELAAMVAAGGPVTQEGDAVYLTKLWNAEHAVADKLRVLMQSASRVDAKLRTEGLAPDQVRAVEQAAASPVFVLTGPPGTGKTFSVRRLIDSFDGAVVELAAPTGKAAKRIFEQTGREARTIHKLLDPQPLPEGGFSFFRTAGNPVAADLVVIDETSMVDTLLMRSLLEAIAPGTRLILVGDTYQLPSVGPGNVLSEILASGVIPSVELDTIKRQDPGDIIQNCHAIKNGRDIAVSNKTSRDFFFLEENDEDAIVQILVDAVSRRLAERYKADPLRDIQVITPMREKGALCCQVLNLALRKALIGVEVPEGGPRFVPRDKVIQTKNAYDLGIINGDIGFVVGENTQTKAWTVDFENPQRRVDVPKKDCNLELAYCVTCHKFQGSEAKIIVMPAHRSFGARLYQRNWIYTAVSRAREVCVLIGQREAVAGAISRNYQVKRFTKLAELLRRPESENDAIEPVSAVLNPHPPRKQAA